MELGDLAILTWAVIVRSRERGFFAEAFCEHEDEAGNLRPPDVANPGAYFLRRLKESDVWSKITDGSSPPVSARIDEDVLFDLIELLYAHVSYPTEEHQPGATPLGVELPVLYKGPFDREEARATFREEINIELKLWNPPLELSPRGQIVERPPDEFRDLEAEIPDEIDPDLRNPLNGAINQFRHRGATADDKRAAIVQLCGILERHRAEIAGGFLSADESELFQLANRFWLRHKDRKQLRDFDEDIWLDWMFYVYLTTARALAMVLSREADSVRADSSPSPELG